MPYLSDAELHEQLARVERNESTSESSGSGSGLGPVAFVGGLGAAGFVGFLRGKFADKSTGEWKLPGSSWDAEAVIVALLAGVALGGKHVGLAEYRGMAAISALAIGSHYLGEISQQFAKTGQLKLTVGDVPPWDPTSFDPTQFNSTHEDAQSRGLSESGV